MPLCEVCQPAVLCPDCYARELFARRPQARASGQVWAERVARAGQGWRASWPTHADRTLEIARRLVAPLATDVRMVEELARACSEGAAEWWGRRPERYRHPIVRDHHH